MTTDEFEGRVLRPFNEAASERGGERVSQKSKIIALLRDGLRAGETLPKRYTKESPRGTRPSCAKC